MLCIIFLLLYLYHKIKSKTVILKKVYHSIGLICNYSSLSSFCSNGVILDQFNKEQFLYHYFVCNYILYMLSFNREVIKEI